MQPHQRLTSLDGLRGWGALSVVLFHVFVIGFPSSPEAGEALRRIFIFNGELAVWIFFVVSGFSLSLGFMTKGDRRSVVRTALGRYARLAIPIASATLLVMAAGPWLVDPAQRPPLFRDFVTEAPSLHEALRFSLVDVFFHYDARTSPIPPLWTMAYELFGSVAVFATLLVFGTWRWRVVGYAAVAASVYILHPIYTAFMAGVMLAAAHVQWPKAESVTRYTLPLVLVGCAWLVRNEPGRLSIPAAILITWCAISNSHFSAFLGHRLSRWLGSISFPLYLTHSTVFYAFSLAMPSGLVTNLLTVAVALVLATIFIPTDRLGVWAARRMGALVFLAGTPKAAGPAKPQNQ